MDKSMMTKVVVVAVVVVIAAAACVVYFNNGSSSGKDAKIDTELQIRGNVNGDYTIDNEDMKILDEILAGTKDAKDYPLADANNDNDVDTKDKELIQDIIDRKSGITVYVLCQDNKGKETTVPVTYPLRNVVTYATNLQLPALYAGGAPYIAGYFSRSYDVAESGLDDAVSMGGTTRQISDASWSKFTAFDAELRESGKGGVGAVIVDYSGIAQFTDARMADLKAAEIPMMAYSSADAEQEITTVLTLGFLFGEDCEKKSLKYAQESWNVIDYVKSKMEGKKQNSYISLNMYIYICQNDSTFNYVGQSAGGIPYYKVNSSFASKYSGTGSTKMTSVEALSNYTDVNSLINIRSMDWGLTADEKKQSIVDTWDHDNAGTSSAEFFKGFEDKLFYIDNLLPGAVKVAYVAHGLYGDQFSLSWADGVLKTFIDLDFGPLKGQTMDSVLAFFDYDDYKAAA